MSDLPVSKKQRLKLDLKAAHIALREVSKHAEAETRRADEAEADRDALSEKLREMARRVWKQRAARAHFAQVFGESAKGNNEWHRRRRIELTKRAEGAEAERDALRVEMEFIDAAAAMAKPSDISFKLTVDGPYRRLLGERVMGEIKQDRLQQRVDHLRKTMLQVAYGGPLKAQTRVAKKALAEDDRIVATEFPGRTAINEEAPDA